MNLNEETKTNIEMKHKIWTIEMGDVQLLATNLLSRIKQQQNYLLHEILLFIAIIGLLYYRIWTGNLNFSVATKLNYSRILVSLVGQSPSSVACNCGIWVFILFVYLFVLFGSNEWLEMLFEIFDDKRIVILQF